MRNPILKSPLEGKVVAPVDAEIATLFPTCHAIGMDKIKIKGDDFKTHVRQGDKVKQGQLLIEFDIDKIKKAGYPVVTNFADRRQRH
ncbi:MAG: PTS glucose transporter subunit IIA [Selenomonadaceae bacterium]|nr:PTS glucose transporter subunit IIA [Selenomonadaceae bacterium]MBR7025882.1 PTS glucose transporter subunit IIA [Selenomonadaceae bacterium]